VKDAESLLFSKPIKKDGFKYFFVDESDSDVIKNLTTDNKEIKGSSVASLELPSMIKGDEEEDE
ncbi:hypothetical protein KI387_034780, partial [Taxus chinensis]